MEIILLERIPKLGQMGDVVRVKDGFARNYLLPKGKALRATEENRAHFQGMKAQLEARNLEQKSEAQKVAEKVNGRKVTVLRQAAEGGQLYGSVSPRDIASLLAEQGFAVTRAQIALHTPIKTIGLHRVPITLHSEVEAMVELTVARNADEAQRIARGESITALREEAREGASEEAAEESAAEAFFEAEVVKAQRVRAPETEPAATQPKSPQKNK
jgi:large subunit ribosomal protein L9